MWWLFAILIANVALAGLLWTAPSFTIGTTLRAAARIAGYRLTYGRFDVHPASATLFGPRITTASGEPVLVADRIELDYRLRDLLPGGRHAFGLVAARLYDPTLTIIHHRDGGYNIALPRSSGGGSASKASPNWNCALSVRNGTVVIVDAFRLYPQSRHQRVEGLTADVQLAQGRPSSYHVALRIVEGQTRYPIAGEAIIDPARGYASHHWTAAQLPLGPLVDYVINSPAVHLESGILHALDVRYYGLENAAGIMNYHLSGSGFFDRGKLYLGQLAKPLRNVNGPLDIDDDGFVFPKVGATVNAVPISLTGGIYHFADPSFRLAARGHGDLARLTALLQTPPAKRVTGSLAFGLLVEGPALNPVLIAAFTSPNLVYDRTALRATNGKIAILGTDLHVLGLRTSYGPIRARVGGVLGLRKEVEPQLVVDADLPANALPYGGAIAPGVGLHAFATIEGTAKDLRTQGFLEGASPDERVAGVFHMNGAGTGSIGPLAIRRSDGSSLYAHVAIDRRAQTMLGFAELHRFSVSPGPIAQFPGMASAALPQVSGIFDASAAFAAAGKHLLAAGNVHAAKALIAGLPIDDVVARFDLSDDQVAARGRYRGSLDQLGPFTANMDARGTIDAPFLLAGDRRNLIAQVDGARFTAASVQGVPITHLSATLGLDGPAVRIYAANAQIAGGSVVASGSFGNGGEIALATSDLDARTLRATGVRLQSGTLAGLARVGGSAGAPQVRGHVALTSGTFAGHAVSADADLALRGSTLNVDAQSVYEGAVAQVRGDVGGIGAGRASVPTYDLNAHVVGFDPQPFLAHQHGVAATTRASVDSDAHIGGAGTRPTLSGELRIPVGSVNGLGFRDATARLRGSGDAFALSGGSVQVGTTSVAFDASLSRETQALAIRAPHAALRDFNDFFDPADTLAGRGRIALDVHAAGNTLATSGDIALHDFRYRRLALGQTSAHWTHNANTVVGRVDIAGKAGTIHVAGNVVAPATDPLRDTLRRSTLNLNASAADADLGVLLPALGYGTPATGSLRANARIRGHYPALLVAANASLEHGTYGKIPIDRLAIATAENGRRTTISSAVLEIPGASTTLSGSFGFGPNDRLALTAKIVSPDLHTLVQRSLGKNMDVAGTLDSTIRLSGTRAQPIVASTTAVRKFRYGKVSLPRVVADVAYQARRLRLQTGEIDLPRGRVTLTGDLPLGSQLARDPLALTLSAQNADLAILAPLLPQGTRIQGVVDGTTQVFGTLGEPQLRGGLSLARGSFVSPIERTPITGIAAQLAFGGRQVQLVRAHAEVGGGSIDASGRAAVGDLRRLAQTASYQMDVRAKHARIDSPAYYTGQIDATTSLVRVAGASPTVMGQVMFSNAIVPFSALYNPNAGGPSSATPLDLAFGLNIKVGPGVRVRSSNVDLGGRGALALSGTLAAPKLAGRIFSTGGTIDFMRTFQVERGVVSFDPAQGILPYVHAVATTHVTNPDTDVTLTVSGLVPNLQLALASDAGYSREQILGLLVNAQSLGAVPGIHAAPGGGFSVSQEAFGLLDQQFTRNLLTPLGTSLGNALGFSSLQLSTDLANGGGIGFMARRKLGRHLTLNFSENATPPMRESIAIEAHPNKATALQFSVFSQRDQTPFVSSTAQLFTNTSNPALTATQPISGTGGFSFSFQRKYR